MIGGIYRCTVLLVLELRWMLLVSLDYVVHIVYELCLFLVVHFVEVHMLRY